MTDSSTNTEKSVCGVVMPISAIDGCDATHWSDVYEILKDVIVSAGFSANLVSNADDVGVIHKRIIQNLYHNPIIVCDVSGKNPNVMFELGVRLAFDKPVIIIKDDKTPYSFDTSSIEHIEYPRDLRFNKINDFKEKLKSKITATLDSYKKSPETTSFLKHFGEFTIAKIESKEVSGFEFLAEELENIKSSIRQIELQNASRSRPSTINKRSIRIKLLEGAIKDEKFMNFASDLSEKYGLYFSPFYKGDGSYMEISIPKDSIISESKIINLIKDYVDHENI